MELIPVPVPRRPSGVNIAHGFTGSDLGDPGVTTRVDGLPVSFRFQGDLGLYVLNDTGFAVGQQFLVGHVCDSGEQHAGFLTIPLGFEGMVIWRIGPQFRSSAGAGSILWIDGGGGYPLATLVHFT